MICAYESLCENCKDPCELRHGRQVLYDGKLCGITSWGVNCGANDYPEIYTNIETISKFIKDFNKDSNKN